MFQTGPIKARQAEAPAQTDTDDRPIVFRITACLVCAGDLYTVLPEDPETIRVLRLVHAECVDF